MKCGLVLITDLQFLVAPESSLSILLLTVFVNVEGSEQKTDFRNVFFRENWV